MRQYYLYLYFYLLQYTTVQYNILNKLPLFSSLEISSDTADAEISIGNTDHCNINYKYD